MSSNKPGKPQPAWGWLCLLLGLYPIAIAFGYLPVEAASVDAPMWVLAACGMVFLLAGLMILLGQDSPLTDMLAAQLCLCFGCVGLWVALLSSPDGFSGGLPLVSREINVEIAR